jgi:hypothetical protein
VRGWREEGGAGVREGVGRRGEKGGEMTQTLYVHMNKRNFKKYIYHKSFNHLRF